VDRKATFPAARHQQREEQPGILNWALDGLERLTITNGNRFTRLASAEEAIIAHARLGKPRGGIRT
jgi:hypothetical protein